MRRIIAAGTLLLFAACGGGSTSPTNTDTVVSVAISPATAQIAPQQTVQLTATPKDAEGTVLSGKSVSWTSTPTGRVTVSSGGLVTGVAAGTATVTATIGGKSATATIVVANTTAIGPTGGTVTAASGNVLLTFPAGAVASTTNISVASMTAPPTTPLTVPGTAYDFGPSGTFAQPVGVSIKYDPAQLPSGTDQSLLRLYTLNGSTWEESPGSWVDVATHTVQGMTTHFSGWITCTFPCYPDAIRVGVTLGGHVYFQMKQGASLIRSAEVYRSNTTADVNLSLEGGPPGLAMAVAQGQYAYNRNLTFTANSSVPIGQYEAVLVARGGGAPDYRAKIYFEISAPGVSVTLNPAAVPVTQGSTAASTLNIARDGVTGPVSFSVTGLPTGVTASFAPSSTTGNSSVMTLTAAANAPIVTTNNAVLKASATGIADDLTEFTVAVISASGFSVVGTPPFASLTQGSTASTGVKALRASGFNGAITWNVTGLVNGLTAAVTTTSVTDSMKVTFTSTAGLAVGNYTVNVVGTANGKSESVPVLVTIGSSGTSTVQLDLSNCITSGKTIWLAAQDGSAAFKVITGSNGLYSFPITSGKGAFAAVVSSSSGNTTYVEFGAPSDLPLSKFCGTPQPTPVATSLSYSAVNVGASNWMDLTLGYTSTTNSGPSPNGNFTFTLPVPADLVAWKYPKAGTDNIRGIIRRDLTFTNNAVVPVMDWNSSEPFTAVGASGAISGGGNPSMGYYSGTSCSQFSVLGNSLTASGTIYGVPAAMQRPGDLHSFGAFLSTSDGYRSVYSLFHTMSSQSLTLPAPLTAPTVTTLAGPYRRIQAAFTLPGDFTIAEYRYIVASNTVLMRGYTSYFNGQAMTMAMPDLSGLAGYNASFFPATTGTMSTAMRGLSLPTFNCADGMVGKESVITVAN